MHAAAQLLGNRAEAKPESTWLPARGSRRGREGIVGNSATVDELIEQINRVGPTNTTVLITGETGTGKELVARAIHRRSRRAARSLVSVNLAATPSELVASELFGHEAGAFTGAIQRRIGRFEMAHQGTLFLDEIGEVTHSVQVALLRTLQEGEIERVGSNQAKAVDVRVVAATNRNLAEAVECGIFRRDLFYRLAVFTISLPPLRERREDIAVLAEHFLTDLENRIGRRFARIHRKSIDRLTSYDWPGNIRELQNVIEHSAILCDGDELQVPDALLSSRFIAGPTSTSNLESFVEDGERRCIEQALQKSHGRVSGKDGAAVLLGIPSSTLETKIQRLSIDKFKYRLESAGSGVGGRSYGRC